MKTQTIILNLILAFLLTSIASCSVIGDIFEAGVWVGVIIVVLIIVAIGYLFSKFRRRS